MNILVVDVGGTNVKLRNSASEEVRKIPSGSTMTPQEMVDKARETAADWKAHSRHGSAPRQVNVVLGRRATRDL